MKKPLPPYLRFLSNNAWHSKIIIKVVNFIKLTLSRFLPKMGVYSDTHHRECRDSGHALTGVMNTLSAVTLTVHMILNVVNANNNNNNNNNNDNNDNNNNNVFTGTLLAEKLVYWLLFL